MTYRLTDARLPVDIVPVTLPRANAFVAAHHRHHAPIPGGFSWWCIGAIVDARLVGVAIAGRPTNRNNDDGQTVEVLRIATDGTANAPSALLGACGRMGRAIGASRVITRSHPAPRREAPPSSSSDIRPAIPYTWDAENEPDQQGVLAL